MRLYGRIRQALLEAKRNGTDSYAAIESVMPWDDLSVSVAKAKKLAQPGDFDFLHRIGESHTTLRRYAAEILCVLKLRAAPAARGLLDAVEKLRMVNAGKALALPADAPTAFIKPR